MSTLRVGTFSNASGSASVPSDTVISGTAKAWVNFNGTGTVAIRAQFNVSSITDNGTGDYTVNFTSALADTNYCVSGFSVALSSTNLTGASMVTYCPSGSGTYLPITKTTSAARILTGNTNSGANTDSEDISFTVFR
jgi:hypothetical protein